MSKCENCKFCEQDGMHEICTADFKCENQNLSQEQEELITDGDW